MIEQNVHCAFARFCGIIITIIIVEKTGFVQSQTVKKLPRRDLILDCAKVNGLRTV